MIKENELSKLNVATPKGEIKYRPGSTFDWAEKKYARMLAYVDARYIQDKLDEIVGIGNWSNQFHRDEKGILYCTITIKFIREDGSVDSVSKTDVGTESNVEQQKGEVSDSFKRCAVHFGLARDLYNLPDPKGFKYVAEMKGNKFLNPNTNSFVVVQQWKPKEEK
tara:strand:+ start:95 stop:589 length:495 start_codon:yes stop_codon:yes gene_type:complete